MFFASLPDRVFLGSDVDYLQSFSTYKPYLGQDKELYFRLRKVGKQPPVIKTLAQNILVLIGRLPPDRLSAFYTYPLMPVI